MLLLTVRVAHVPVGRPEVKHGVEQQAAVWGQEHGGCRYPHILSLLSSLYYLVSVLSILCIIYSLYYLVYYPGGDVDLPRSRH